MSLSAERQLDLTGLKLQFFTLLMLISFYNGEDGQVAERFIEAVRDSQKKIGEKTLFCSFDPVDIRQQAAASSERYAAGELLANLVCEATKLLKMK